MAATIQERNSFGKNKIYLLSQLSSQHDPNGRELTSIFFCFFFPFGWHNCLINILTHTQTQTEMKDKSKTQHIGQQLTSRPVNGPGKLSNPFGQTISWQPGSKTNPASQGFLLMRRTIYRLMPTSLRRRRCRWRPLHTNVFNIYTHTPGSLIDIKSQKPTDSIDKCC